MKGGRYSISVGLDGIGRHAVLLVEIKVGVSGSTPLWQKSHTQVSMVRSFSGEPDSAGNRSLLMPGRAWRFTRSLVIPQLRLASASQRWLSKYSLAVDVIATQMLQAIRGTSPADRRRCKSTWRGVRPSPRQSAWRRRLAPARGRRQRRPTRCRWSSHPRRTCLRHTAPRWCRRFRPPNQHHVNAHHWKQRLETGGPAQIRQRIERDRRHIAAARVRFPHQPKSEQQVDSVHRSSSQKRCAHPVRAQQTANHRSDDEADPEAGAQLTIAARALISGVTSAI